MNVMLHEGRPDEAGLSPERLDHIRRLCAGWVEAGLTPALQVAVARRGVLALHAAWGRTGPEPDAPALGVDAIFGIASITKPITATAVMCLVEDGLLGLNRPVQEYVPEFVGEGKAAVMVHHVLTHTSGLRDEDLDTHALAKITDGVIRPPAPVPFVQPHDFLFLRCFDAVHDAPLRTPPGAEMAYCNYGYRVLAEIVTRVAGRPVERFVQERVLDPLGMVNTSYDGVPPSRRNRVVRRAADAPLVVLNDPDVMAGLGLGAGSTYATALDVATFGHLFLAGGRAGPASVLSPASIAAMTCNQIPGISAWEGDEFFPEASWGLGWSVQGTKKSLRDPSFLSPVAVSHYGGGGAYVWLDPATEVVGVHLSIARGMVTATNYDRNNDLFANAVTAAVVD